MFFRKLRALNYSGDIPENFDTDSAELRALWYWLGCRKLRCCSTDLAVTELEELQNVNSQTWPQVFQQFLSSLDCPWSCDQPAAVTEWLLRKSVEVDYRDIDCRFNVSEDSKRIMVLKGESTKGRVVENGYAQATSLANVTDDGDELRSGLDVLCRLLGIVPHHDTSVTLEAVSSAINDCLSKNASQAESKDVAKGFQLAIDEIPLGFDCHDPDLRPALTVMRLLHIRGHRKLQTQCDEALVALQRITADPKTDEKLGHVGKF